MRQILGLIAMSGALALACPAKAQDAGVVPPDTAWARYPSATSVRIEGAAAIVRVTPQMRSDSAYVIVNTGPLPDPEVRVRGARLIIDGGLERRIEGCAFGESVTVRGFGNVPLAQLPVIYVRTPESLVLEANGGLAIEVGPSTSARVGVSGCSQARIGPVTQQASVALEGNAMAQIGPSGRARIAIAGDGQAILGPVSQGLDIAIAGDGRVQVQTIGGDVRVGIQGDGYVDIGSGQIDELRVAIAGDGYVRFAGEADTVTAAIAGSGLIEVARARGAVEQRVAGNGEVRVGPLGPAPHALDTPRP